MDTGLHPGPINPFQEALSRRRMAASNGPRFGARRGELRPAADTAQGDVVRWVTLPNGKRIPITAPSGQRHVVKNPGARFYSDPGTGEPLEIDMLKPGGVKSAWDGAPVKTDKKTGEVFKELPGHGRKNLGVDPHWQNEQAQKALKEQQSAEAKAAKDKAAADKAAQKQQQDDQAAAEAEQKRQREMEKIGIGASKRLMTESDSQFYEEARAAREKAALTRADLSSDRKRADELRAKLDEEYDPERRGNLEKAQSELDASIQAKAARLEEQELEVIRAAQRREAWEKVARPAMDRAISQADDESRMRALPNTGRRAVLAAPKTPPPAEPRAQKPDTPFPADKPRSALDELRDMDAALAKRDAAVRIEFDAEAVARGEAEALKKRLPAMTPLPGMNVPRDWLTPPAHLARQTAREVGKADMNLPPDYDLAAPDVSTGGHAGEQALTWKGIRVGGVRRDARGVARAYISGVSSPSLDGGTPFDGVPEYAHPPEDFRAHLTTQEGYDANDEESIREAWEARHWTAGQVRKTITDWQNANDDERADMLLEMQPERASEIAAWRKNGGSLPLPNLRSLHQSGFVSRQEARLLDRVFSGAEPGHADLKAGWEAFKKDSTSKAAAVYRDTFKLDPLLDGGSDVWRRQKAAGEAAAAQYLADYFQQNNRRPDFDLEAFNRERDTLLGGEPVNRFRASLEDIVQNVLGSLAGIFTQVGKAATLQLSEHEMEMIGGQTRGAMWGFGNVLKDVFTPGSKNKDATAAADELFAALDHETLTDARLRELTGKIQQSALAYVRGEDLAENQRGYYDALNPESPLAAALMAYKETRDPAYKALFTSAMLSTPGLQELQARVAAHASDNGMIAPSDAFALMRTSFKGAQVAPVQETALEIASNLVGFGVGKLVKGGVRGAKVATAAGRGVNAAQRALLKYDDLAARFAGWGTNAATPVRNMAVQGAKVMGASAGGEAFEEGVMALHESGATFSDVWAASVQGALGGMMLVPMFTSGGAAMNAAQKLITEKRGLNAFVKDWNAARPDDPLIAKDARQLQGYLPVDREQRAFETLRAAATEMQQHRADLVAAAGGEEQLREIEQAGHSHPQWGKIAPILEMREASQQRVRAEAAAQSARVEQARAAMQEVNGIADPTLRAFADAALRHVSGHTLTPQERAILESARAGVPAGPVPKVDVPVGDPKKGATERRDAATGTPLAQVGRDGSIILTQRGLDALATAMPRTARALLPVDERSQWEAWQQRQDEISRQAAQTEPQAATSTDRTAGGNPQRNTNPVVTGAGVNAPGEMTPRAAGVPDGGANTQTTTSGPVTEYAPQTPDVPHGTSSQVNPVATYTVPVTVRGKQGTTSARAVSVSATSPEEAAAKVAAMPVWKAMRRGGAQVEVGAGQSAAGSGQKAVSQQQESQTVASQESASQPEAMPEPTNEAESAEAQDAAREQVRPLARVLREAAAGFGYKIVDTGLPFGFTDRYGTFHSLGTQIFDKAVPGSELGQWIDKIANSQVADHIRENMTSPGLHRVWFGHDPLASIGAVVERFGITALPEYAVQLLKDMTTKSGIPLPGVQWLVHKGVIGDRAATEWLSLNVGEALGAGLGLLGTYKLYKRARNGQDIHAGWVALGIAFKITGGVLSANPVLLISGLADTAILVAAKRGTMKAGLQKLRQEERRGDGETGRRGEVATAPAVAAEPVDSGQSPAGGEPPSSQTITGSNEQSGSEMPVQPGAQAEAGGDMVRVPDTSTAATSGASEELKAAARAEFADLLGEERSDEVMEQGSAENPITPAPTPETDNQKKVRREVATAPAVAAEPVDSGQSPAGGEQKAETKAAPKALMMLKAAVKHRAGAFDQVEAGPVASGGGMEVVRGGDGKITLRVDTSRFMRHHAGSPKALIEQLVDHEVIHAGTLREFTDAEIASLWSRLPERLRHNVYAAYHAAEIMAGELPRRPARADLAAMGVSLGHEMLRMLLEDRVFQREITEAAQADPGLAAEIVAFLKRLVSRLRGMIEGADPELRALVEWYESRAVDALERLGVAGKGAKPPPTRLAGEVRNTGQRMERLRNHVRGAEAQTPTWYGMTDDGVVLSADGRLFKEPWEARRNLAEQARRLGRWLAWDAGVVGRLVEMPPLTMEPDAHTRWFNRHGHLIDPEVFSILRTADDLGDWSTAEMLRSQHRDVAVDTMPESMEQGELFERETRARSLEGMRDAVRRRLDDIAAKIAAGAESLAEAKGREKLEALLTALETRLLGRRPTLGQLFGPDSDARAEGRTQQDLNFDAETPPAAENEPAEETATDQAPDIEPEPEGVGQAMSDPEPPSSQTITGSNEQSGSEMPVQPGAQAEAGGDMVRVPDTSTTAATSGASEELKAAARAEFADLLGEERSDEVMEQGSAENPITPAPTPETDNQKKVRKAKENARKRKKGQPESQPTTESTPAAMIGDFGEKIGGARKDAWKIRGLNVDDLGRMTTEERDGYTTKDQVWPKPDYAQWVKDGMDPVLAYQLKTIRDGLSAKPDFSKAGYFDTPEQTAAKREKEREQYVTMLGIFRDRLPAMRDWKEFEALMSELWGRDQPAYGGGTGRAVTTWSDESHGVFTGRDRAGRKKWNNSVWYNPSSVQRKARAFIERTGWPVRNEPWMRFYDVNESKPGSVTSSRDPATGEWVSKTLTESEFFVSPRGGYSILAQGFLTRDLAEAWAAAKYEADQKNKTQGGGKVTRPLNPNPQRTGEDYRKGVDVTGQDLLDTFGFRGGEFGNWTNQADRQQALNAAFDALHDLARVMGVPPKAMSLGGKMGIAFGARGKGKAAAHYEPVKLVINLTRTSGAGALAHEWGHALDDHFGKLGGGSAGAMQTNRLPAGTLRPAMLKAWQQVWNALATRTKEQATVIAETKEKIARGQKSLQSWIPQAVMDNENTGPLVRMLMGALPKQLDSGPATFEEVAARLKQFWPKDVKAYPTKGITQNGSFIAHWENRLARAEAGMIRGEEPTKFITDAKEIGEYWERKHELFARAFESWVQSRIEATGAKSEYLVHSTVKATMAGGLEGETDSDAKARDKWASAYPQGRDAVAIWAAFDQFKDTLESVEQEDGSVTLRAPLPAGSEVFGRRKLPPEKRDGFIRLAGKMDAEGVNTPEKLAAFLDETFPGGAARPYSQALWTAIGVVNQDALDTAGRVDWAAVYGQKSNNPETGGQTGNGVVSEADASTTGVEAEPPGTRSFAPVAEADIVPQSDAGASAPSWSSVLAKANDITIQEFAQLALLGRIHRATGAVAEQNFGTLKTPLSIGFTSGYSLEDIAHFYVSRRSPRSVRQEIEAQSDPATNPQIVQAFDEFAADALHEHEAQQKETGAVLTNEAVRAAASVVDTEPTDAQKEAGNYQKGHVKLHGMDISIENPRGSVRSGTDRDGKAWSVTMPHHYGYIRRTVGKDGDNIDVFIGPNPASERVFIVDQVKQGNGHFDEHKVLLGFDSEEEARAGYEAAFTKGWKVGPMFETTVADLKAWLAGGDLTRKAKEQFEEAGQESSSDQGVKRTPEMQAVEDIAHRIAAGGERMTQPELVSIAEKATGRKLGPDFTIKDVYDLMEMAVNKLVMESYGFNVLTSSAAAAALTVTRLKEVLALLPTMSRRTEEMDAMQQFSTPPSLSYAAAWVANLRGPEVEDYRGKGGMTKRRVVDDTGDVLLEPSAGLGGLAMWGKQAGAEVIANELSKRRHDLLKQSGIADTVTNENAELLHAIYEPRIAAGEMRRPTVVVMNPPFSNAATSKDKSTKIGALHVEQALRLLPAGGRLVAIVGRGMSDDAPAFKAWWARMKRDYAVRANIRVDGKEYQRYGTTFDNQLVVIDKLPPGDNTTVTGEVATVEELIPLLAPVRHARGNQRTEPAADQSAGPQSPEAAESGGDSRADTSAGARPGGARGGRPRSGRKRGQRGDAAAGGVGTKPEDTGNGVALPESGDGRSEPTAGDDTGGNLEPDTGSAGTGLVRADTGGTDAASRAELSDDDIFATYTPRKAVYQGAHSHPSPLVESAAMASVEAPDVTYTPKLDAKVISEGRLSDAQLEAVTYAGQAHQRELATGERAGFFIGDGTGVGKGRELAGIIADNWNQGRKRAVWISKSKNLAKDARRDLDGLGLQKAGIIELGKVKTGAPIEAKEGVLFATYATLKGAHDGLDDQKQPKGAKGKPSRMQQLYNWLGKDYDGVIALDEAHMAGNAMDMKGNRGMKKASATGLAVVDLQAMFPKARVVYASATGATEPSNFSYAARLGLWGPGTAFANREKFFQEIAAQGVSAMEVLARDLKALGSYIARTLSFKGVDFTRVTHEVTPEQRKIYDQMAESWQMVYANVDQAMGITGANKNGNARSAAMSAFWSANQRFFNQILTAMQMPSVLADMKAKLDAGGSVVVQLTNTNEAIQERALAQREDEADEESGTNLDNLDLSPKDVLLQFVQNSWPTAKYIKTVDDNGNEKWTVALDANNKPVIDPDAVALREQTLSRLASLRVPENPLEQLLETFGAENVSEITGRSRRVVSQPQADGTRKRVIEDGRSDARRLVESREFQDGKRRVLVFSDAGGTGFSYHAATGAKNRQRRYHYLVQAGWRADTALQGFGRTHRSDQVQTPFYVLASTDIKGHQRFISTIARRLAQLGALTTGERKAAGQGMFSETDNLESSYARTAVKRLFYDLFANRVPGFDFADITMKMGYVRREVNEKTGNTVAVSTLIDQKQNTLDEGKLPTIQQFLNRILAVNIEEQNRLFEAFMERMERGIAAAKEGGHYDPGTQTFKADKIEATGGEQVYTHPGTSAGTRIEAVKASRRIHYTPFDFIARRKPEMYVRNLRSGRVYALADGGHRTTESGAIVDLYARISPTGSENLPRMDVHLDGEKANYEKLSEAQTRELWTREITEGPEFSEDSDHFLVGMLLPIWDRAKMTVMRIFRVNPENGTPFLGLHIHPKELDAVRARLGAGAVKKTPAQWFADVIKQGKTLDLANGWRVQRARSLGDYRLEVVGPQWENKAEFESWGGFTERVSWTLRWFMPGTEAEGAAALEKLITRHPVVSGADELTLGAPTPWEKGDAIKFIPLQDLDGAMQRLEDWMWRRHREWRQKSQSTGSTAIEDVAEPQGIASQGTQKTGGSIPPQTPPPVNPENSGAEDRALRAPVPARPATAHQANIVQQGAKMRNAAAAPAQATGGKLPTARGATHDAGSLLRDLFYGRHDALEAIMPGTKRLIQENRLDAGFARAAVTAMMDQVRRRIEGAFGSPKFWNVKRKGKMTRFLSELLPVASRLNATGYTPAGALVFSDFDRPIGFISDAEMAANNYQVGDAVPLPGSASQQLVNIGPRATERGGHVLTEPMPASTQAQIFTDFSNAYPEGAWVVEEFVMPGLEQVREVGPGGTTTPAFNRGSILNFLNDDWPPALQALFTAQPLPPVALTEGWTPDMARQKTAAAYLGALLRTFIATARKTRTGERIESGDLHDLLDGFEIAAFEGQMEKSRLVIRNKLINQTATAAPPPASGLREYLSQWTPLDDVIHGTIKAYVLTRKADLKLIPDKGKPLTAEQRALATRLLGDGVRFWGTDMALPRRIYQEFIAAEARDVVTNRLLRAVDWFIKRYVAGLMVDLGTFFVNVASNPVLRQMAGMNRLAYAMTSAAHGDWAGAKLGALEWAHLMRGLVMDQLPLLNKRILSALPPEIYDDNTTYAQADGIDPMKGALAELKDFNPGAAFLKTVRYGSVDQGAKVGVHYALLRARASVAADKARVKGAARKAFITDWMNNARTRHRQEFEETYQQTLDFMLDMANDVPAIIDPSQNLFTPGGQPSQLEKVIKRGVFSLFRYKAAMVRYGVRNTIGSARALMSPALSAERKAQAAANLLMMAGLAAFGWLLTGIDGDEDDDPLVGRQQDDYGRLLPQSVRTGDRVNLSRAGRMIAGWLRRHGVPIREDGTVEPGATEEDLWVKTSKLPLTSSAILLGHLLNGEVAEAMSATGQFWTDLQPTGPLVRLNPLTYDASYFDQGKSYRVVAADQLFDMLTAPILPSRLRESVVRIVDPQDRLLKPEPDIGYNPGLREVFETNIPWLSLMVPPRATYESAAPTRFSATAWRKEKLAAIARAQDLTTTERDELRAEVDARFPALLAAAAQQRELLEGFGIPASYIDTKRTGTKEWPAELQALKDKGYDATSGVVSTGEQTITRDGVSSSYARLFYPDPATLGKKTGADFLLGNLTGLNLLPVRRGALHEELNKRKVSMERKKAADNSAAKAGGFKEAMSRRRQP